MHTGRFAHLVARSARSRIFRESVLHYPVENVLLYYVPSSASDDLRRHDARQVWRLVSRVFFSKSHTFGRVFFICTLIAVCIAAIVIVRMAPDHASVATTFLILCLVAVLRVGNHGRWMLKRIQKERSQALSATFTSVDLRVSCRWWLNSLYFHIPGILILIASLLSSNWFVRIFQMQSGLVWVTVIQLASCLTYALWIFILHRRIWMQRIRSAAARDLCSNCQFPIKGIKAHRCPECGYQRWCVTERCLNPRLTL